MPSLWKPRTLVDHASGCGWPGCMTQAAVGRRCWTKYDRLELPLQVVVGSDPSVARVITYEMTWGSRSTVLSLWGSALFETSSGWHTLMIASTNEEVIQTMITRTNSPIDKKESVNALKYYIYRLATYISVQTIRSNSVKCSRQYS